MSKISHWGYRSEKIKKEFKKIFGVDPSFRCYSGIPERYLQNQIERDWGKCDKYVYVGQLIQRKYPDVVITALRKYYGPNTFSFSIIGDGPMYSDLEKLIANDTRIDLKGHLSREAIRVCLDECDVFIMISANEVFGLVYIEAMARGCIVIAAKDEGMEGIIVDGENGFLCESGSEEGLVKVIRGINCMSPEQRKIISDNARKTATNLTDSKVAKDYLNALLKM